jgi:hypothetical protein
MHTSLINRLILITWIALIASLATPAAAQPPQSEASTADEPGGFDAGGADIRIITEGDKTIEEYSLNGRVYMVKIQQKGFPPYYLIDRNGDGRMDEQVSELMGPATPPPNWVLFRW